MSKCGSIGPQRDVTRHSTKLHKTTYVEPSNGLNDLKNQLGICRFRDGFYRLMTGICRSGHDSGDRKTILSVTDMSQDMSSILGCRATDFGSGICRIGETILQIPESELSSQHIVPSLRSLCVRHSAFRNC